MSDPSKLYSHLPDCYDRSKSSDLYKLLAGLSVGTGDAQTALNLFRDDLSLSSAKGSGLTRWGENFSLSRPPGMVDSFWRKVIAVIAGRRRGTVAIIKDVLETATGRVWKVFDRQLDFDKGTNYGIPAFEVWASSNTLGNLYGLAYSSYATHINGTPEESGISGQVINSLGIDGGRYNDHAWFPVSWWVMGLVDKVRPAGVKVVYKDF